jgi:MFS family permease
MAEKISKKQEEKLKEEARKISIKEGSAYSVMDGFGLRYITPYALALGANNTQIGLLSSIPNLLGSFFQLHTIKVMKIATRKRIVFLGVLLQALMWLALIGIGALYFIFHINSQTAPDLLIIIYSLLILFGSFTNPAWNSWMKDIIPKKFGRYIGIRNRVVGFVAIVSMLIAGFLLDYFKKWNLFLGFIVLFTISFFGRAYSAYLFTKQYEPKLINNHNVHFNMIYFLRRIFKSNFGRFTLFVSLMILAVSIASPFFAVYMLKNLGFNYISYIIVSMSASVSSFIFMPAWGKFSDKYGNLKIMRICGAAIPSIALLWLVSALFLKFNPLFLVVYLTIVELFSGFVWAGFNLAAGNFIYDVADAQKVAPLTSYFNIMTNVGAFIGALLGGIIASLPFKVLGLNAILFVMLFSALARLVIFLIFSFRIKEVRKVKTFGIKEAKEKFMHLNFKEATRIIK